MRTVAQELRRTLRFKADRRERAAPLVIVLDILVPAFFFCEGRRGSLCSKFTWFCEGGKVLRWTTRCKKACELRGNCQKKHCRENCQIAQLCQTFAKNRFVPEQSVVAKDQMLTGCPICGTSQGCADTGAVDVSTTLLSEVLSCATLLVACILELPHCSLWS